MKKLFSLLTLALLTLSLGATTVTFTAGTDMGTNGASGNPDSMTKDGITISGTDLATTTAEYRLYAGSTTTFSSTVGNITSIEFTCTATGENKYGPGCLSTQTGEYIYDGKDGLWSGSATSIAFAASKQVRCTKIVVTVDDGGTTPVVDKVATPTFTPYNADGYHFTGSLAVTVSCETENAAIALYKVVDGEIDYSTYQYIFQSGEVYVTENTTYVAMASKGDMEDSEYAYATYVLDNDNPDPQVTDYIKFNHADDAETSRGEFTVTRNGASFTVSDGLVGAESYRIYKGATITFSSTVGNIVKIEFDGYNSSYKVSGFGENDGMTYEGNNGTWTGDAATVTLTVNDSQVRASEIRVYVNGEVPVTVMDPTFDPSDGYTFNTETLDVTINCATEGATIVYVVNNGDEVEAAAPATVTLTETSTIMAYAKLGEVESNIVEASYTKGEPIQTEYVTFNSTEDKGDGTASTNPWTVVKDGVTMACSSGRVYDEGYRVYQNSTLTFTSTVGNIIRIEFDGVSSYPISRLSANAGELTTSGNDGVWTGKTPEVIFTAGQQARATEIRVYVDGDTTAVVPVEIAAPVFTPAHNTTFIGSQEVSITCATEGAQIYYGFDGETFEAYTGAFTITDACTVYAYAQLGEDKSATVSAKYYKALEVANIAEANALKDKTNFAYNGEAVVTYQWKNEKNGYISTWIKDATGYGLIYGKQVPELTTGQVLADGWDAQKTTYNSIPEFQYPNNVTASEDVVTVEPVEMTEIDTTCVNMYIIMKGQTLTIDETDTTGCTWLNEAELKFYNQFFKNEGLNIESGKKYDVVGIATIYKHAPEFYIISATEVAEQTWEIGDVNHSGGVDIEDVTALINKVLGNATENFFPEQANCTGDAEGSIDIEDVTALINRVLNGAW